MSTWSTSRRPGSVLQSGLLGLAICLLAAATAPAPTAAEAEGEAFGAAYRLGMEAVAREDYITGLDKLEEALRAAPNDLRIGTDYRQAVIAAGEYDRALEFFEALTEAHPDAAKAHLNHGMAHVDKIPTEGAITQVILANTGLTHFTRSLEVEESWLAYYTRGNSYNYWPAIFKRTHLGIADLERAIALSEADPQRAQREYYGRAYAALGDSYWRLEDLGRSREIWRQGAALYPEEPHIQARLSRDDEALDTYLDELFDTNRRVETHLREIWAAEEAISP